MILYGAVSVIELWLLSGNRRWPSPPLLSSKCRENRRDSRCFGEICLYYNWVGVMKAKRPPCLLGHALDSCCTAAHGLLNRMSAAIMDLSERLTLTGFMAFPGSLQLPRREEAQRCGGSKVTAEGSSSDGSLSRLSGHLSAGWEAAVCRNWSRAPPLLICGCSIRPIVELWEVPDSKPVSYSAVHSGSSHFSRLLVFSLLVHSVKHCQISMNLDSTKHKAENLFQWKTWGQNLVLPQQSRFLFASFKTKFTPLFELIYILL